jgi:hypothetical protein
MTNIFEAKILDALNALGVNGLHFVNSQTSDFFVIAGPYAEGEKTDPRLIDVVVSHTAALDE